MNIGEAQKIYIAKKNIDNYFLGRQNDVLRIQEELLNQTMITYNDDSISYKNLSDVNSMTGIKKIKISSFETTIPSNKFLNCTSLEEVTFGMFSALTTIENYAFNGCTNLNNITIPKNVTSIGSNTFNGVSNCDLHIKATTAENLQITNNDNYKNDDILNKNFKGGIFTIKFITMYSSIEFENYSNGPHGSDSNGYWYFHNKTDVIIGYDNDGNPITLEGSYFIPSNQGIQYPFSGIYIGNNELVPLSQAGYNLSLNPIFSNEIKIEMKKAMDKLDMIIEKKKNPDYENTKMKMQIYGLISVPMNLSSGYTLAAAGISSQYSGTFGDSLYAASGYFMMNNWAPEGDIRSDKYTTDTSKHNGVKNNYDIKYNNGNSSLYNIVIHELGHTLGIGNFWSSSGAPVFKYGIQYGVNDQGNQYEISSKKMYTGENAVREYKKYFSGYTNLAGLPIEDDGGTGTEGAHPEEGNEGSTSSDNRYYNGVYHPGLDKELMTGWIDKQGTTNNYDDVPLSRITIGFLDDLGFYVNYDECETYRGI
tara:strand:- start:7450 stop:9054 length:1605 start_codon:yes stop_codon:yes gene_type:complete